MSCDRCAVLWQEITRLKNVHASDLAAQVQHENAAVAEALATRLSADDVVAAINVAKAEARREERGRLEVPIGTLLGMVESVLEFGLEANGTDRLERAAAYMRAALRAEPEGGPPASAPEGDE